MAAHKLVPAWEPKGGSRRTTSWYSTSMAGLHLATTRLIKDGQGPHSPLLLAAARATADGAALQKLTAQQDSHVFNSFREGRYEPPAFTTALVKEGH